jgi:RNA polymerase sigma-70 factor, ECF subfamily
MECSESKSFSIIHHMPVSTAISERVLLARCKSGDDAAFTELIRRSSPIALRTIRAIAHNAADVEDVMQDTVVNALKGLHAFDQRGTLRDARTPCLRYIQHRQFIDLKTLKGAYSLNNVEMTCARLGAWSSLIARTKSSL